MENEAKLASVDANFDPFFLPYFTDADVDLGGYDHIIMKNHFWLVDEK